MVRQELLAGRSSTSHRVLAGSARRFRGTLPLAVRSGACTDSFGRTPPRRHAPALLATAGHRLRPHRRPASRLPMATVSNRPSEPSRRSGHPVRTRHNVPRSHWTHRPSRPQRVTSSTDTLSTPSTRPSMDPGHALHTHHHAPARPRTAAPGAQPPQTHSPAMALQRPEALQPAPVACIPRSTRPHRAARHFSLQIRDALPSAYAHFPFPHVMPDFAA
jgi:hypothetical protein